MSWARMLAVVSVATLPAGTLALAAWTIFPGASPQGPASRQMLGPFLSAGIATFVVLGTALLVLVRSPSRASLPLFATFAWVSVLISDALLGSLTALAAPRIAATCLLPAAIGHLALRFPSRRQVLRGWPELPGLLYVGGALLAGMALVNSARAPAVTQMAMRMGEGFAAAAWLALLIACALAYRESHSLLERARARVVFVASLCVPVAALALWSTLPETKGDFGLSLIGALLLPLPVAYAISRYELFDLDAEVRQAVAYLVSLGLCAALITGLWMLASRLTSGGTLDPGVVLGVAFFGLGLADWARAPLARSLRHWVQPRVAQLDRLADAHARQSVRNGEEDEIAQELCRFAGRGVAPASVSVFLASSFGWRLAGACGAGPHLDSHSAARGALLLGDRSLLHLAHEEVFPGPEFEALRKQNIELVVALRTEGQLRGVLLVVGGEVRNPLERAGRTYLRTLCAQSALALQCCLLTRRLAGSEVFAALGRVNASVAHDVAKPLAVLDLLARALLERERERSTGSDARDLETIVALSGEARLLLRSLIEDSSREVSHFRVAAAIDRAVRSIERRHETRTITVTTPPRLPCVLGDPNALTRALLNLFENALLASPNGEWIELEVQVVGSTEIQIDVLDHGSGMQPEVLRRAFEPFYGDRETGQGLGLAISRELIESMGGKLELSSRAGSGTRARITLPLHETGAVPEGAA